MEEFIANNCGLVWFWFVSIALIFLVMIAEFVFRNRLIGSNKPGWHAFGASIKFSDSWRAIGGLIVIAVVTIAFAYGGNNTFQPKQAELTEKTKQIKSTDLSAQVGFSLFGSQDSTTTETGQSKQDVKDDTQVQKANEADSPIQAIPFILAVLSWYLVAGGRRWVNALKNDNRKKDTYNHYLQQIALLLIGAVIVTTIVCFGLNSSNFLPFGVCAAVMTLIFSDSIRGVVAYYNLRTNNLLHIGDWIQMPSHDIDGQVTRISLVTVTVKNWDNSKSNVAIYALQSSAFKNNQDILAKRTSGRRMYRSFLIDSSSICNLNDSSMADLRSRLVANGVDQIILDNHLHEPQNTLNIHLYRMYIRHYLMNHRDISRAPRLVVRLLEPTPEGIPLQVYTFIIHTSLMPFEFTQSAIMEHMLMSMEWFGLRLYQKPSSEDVNKLIKQA